MSRGIAIIGLGHRGKQLARAIVDRASPLYLFDADLSIGQKAKVEIGNGLVLASLGELLAMKPEVVVVAVPPVEQWKVSIAAMNAGAHVFCEKPLGVDSAAARSILDAADAAGVHAGAGLDLAFVPTVRAGISAVRAGAVGIPRAISAGWVRGWFPGERRTATPGWMARRSLGGGVLRDLGMHVLDIAVRAAGGHGRGSRFHTLFDGRLGAAAAVLRGCAWDVEDTVSAVGTFGGGPEAVSVSVYASWLSEPEGEERIWVDVAGEEGVLRIASRGKSRVAATLHRRGEPPCALGEPAPMDVAALPAFLDAVRSGQRASTRGLRRLLQALDAIEAGAIAQPDRAELLCEGSP